MLRSLALAQVHAGPRCAAPPRRESCECCSDGCWSGRCSRTLSGTTMRCTESSRPTRGGLLATTAGRSARRTWQTHCASGRQARRSHRRPRVLNPIRSGRSVGETRATAGMKLLGSASLRGSVVAVRATCCTSSGQHKRPLCRSVALSLCLCLSVSLSLCLSVALSLSLCLCRSVSLCLGLSVSASASASLSLCLSLSLSLCYISPGADTMRPAPRCAVEMTAPSVCATRRAPAATRSSGTIAAARST